MDALLAESTVCLIDRAASVAIEFGGDRASEWSEEYCKPKAEG